MSIKLGQAELRRILYGAAFLGSGGGGKIENGRVFMKEILGLGKLITLLESQDIYSQKLQEEIACIVANIGSPEAFDPKQSTALEAVFSELQDHIGLSSKTGMSNCHGTTGTIKAVYPIELGAENTLAPMVLAAKQNIPYVVDGDGARRAVPILDLCTFSSIKNSGQGLVAAIANGAEDTMLITSKEVSKFDNFLRAIANSEEFMNSASLALWPDKLEELDKRSISGSISLAMYCGQLFEGKRTGNSSLIKKALPHVNNLQGSLLAQGVIKDIVEESRGGFDWKTVIIEAQKPKSTISLLVQNENLIAYSDKKPAPLAVAPTSICYLTREFCPLTNAEVEIGSFTYVIGIDPAEELKEVRILEGFQRKLLKLGYGGPVPVPLHNPQPLGNLINSL